MAHFVFLPLGSAGDVFPFLGMGRAMMQRGHRVTVVTACLFEKAVCEAGLDFVPVGEEEDFDRLARDPRLWKMGTGTRLVFEYACKAAEQYFAILEKLRASGDGPDLIMAPMTAFAGRMAREKWGIPLVTVHLQPAALISAWEMPILAPGMQYLRRAPLWLKKAILRLPNPVDAITRPRLRAICSQIGIEPPRSLSRDWWNSPDGALLLFPEWFAAPQPDWPEPRLQWDFPLEDLRTEQPLSEDLQPFLNGLPEKPVVITAGSANLQASDHFASLVEGLRLTGKPGVLVTRDLSQLPAVLPPNMIAVEYVPFGPLLERCAAFVHHGGIGTLAQGFAAGVPQLIFPLAHDQFDNADRLERLGAGLSLSKHRLQPIPIAAKLQALLSDPSILNAAQGLALRLSKKRDDSLWRWLEDRAIKA